MGAAGAKKFSSNPFPAIDKQWAGDSPTHLPQQQPKKGSAIHRPLAQSPTTGSRRYHQSLCRHSRVMEFLLFFPNRKPDFCFPIIYILQTVLMALPINIVRRADNFIAVVGNPFGQRTISVGHRRISAAMYGSGA